LIPERRFQATSGSYHEESSRNAARSAVYPLDPFYPYQRCVLDISPNSLGRTMKRILAGLLISALFAGSLTAQAKPGLASEAVDASTRAALEGARDSVWRAWFAGDAAALARLIPGALAAGSPNEWEDRSTTIASSRDFAKRGGKLEQLSFDSTTIFLRGNVAVVHSRYTYVLRDQSGKRTTNRGIATEVFVKEKARWTNPFWYLQ
jgi:hypothetical protein